MTAKCIRCGVCGWNEPSVQYYEDIDCYYCNKCKRKRDRIIEKNERGLIKKFKKWLNLK